MAVDLLSIARSGVLASQQQIAVTGNNITNVNTAGYHRQVANQSTLGAVYEGGNFYGTGAYVTDVKRIYNDYAARELRIGGSSLSAAQTDLAKMSELDNLFSQVGKQVPESLKGFFESLNNLTDLPNDAGMREGVLSSAAQLMDSIKQMQSNLNGQVTQTNTQISGVTDRINEISKEIAAINDEMMKSPENPMHLLDQQERLIQELSTYAEVNVIPLEQGGSSIMLGGSVMLVSGNIGMELGTTEGNPFPEQMQITAKFGDKQVAFDASSVGGQLGALIQFRDESVLPAISELGQMALGIADAFNKQQSQGLDANGNVGQNLFTDINDPSLMTGRVGAHGSNKGSAELSVNITDVGALSGNNYQLQFTAPDSYTLKDTKTGVETPMKVNGTTLEGPKGFSIEMQGAMQMVIHLKLDLRPVLRAILMLP